MSTSFLLVYLVILILSGCTTIEKPSDNSLINREEESVKAIAEEWRKSRRDYLDRSLEVAGQVGLLGRHPGWSDMVDIMRANQGITFVEGEEVAKVKTRLAFDEWSKKWQTSWVKC
jgi:hypothetical protein